MIQSWSRSVSPYGTTMSQWVNTENTPSTCHICRWRLLCSCALFSETASYSGRCGRKKLQRLSGYWWDQNFWWGVEHHGSHLSNTHFHKLVPHKHWSEKIRLSLRTMDFSVLITILQTEFDKTMQMAIMKKYNETLKYINTPYPMFVASFEPVSQHDQLYHYSW